MVKIRSNRSLIWKRLFTLFALLICLSSFTQSTDQKVWNEGSPLTWDDFKALEKGKNSPNESRSNTLIGELHRYRRIGNDTNSFVFEFQVKSVMIRSHSWVEPGYKTPELLAHEQLHFDISEYFARQLLLAFKGATYTRNFENEVLDIRYKLSVQRNYMENLYDEQTVHSLNKAMQLKWAEYVHSLLQKNENLENALKTIPKK